jgi:hypothetical protein
MGRDLGTERTLYGKEHDLSLVRQGCRGWDIRIKGTFRSAGPAVRLCGTTTIKDRKRIDDTKSLLKLRPC